MTDPIRSLLGDAIADAPPPPAFPATPIAAPNHRGRWMAAAAAAVLIACTVVAIAVNHGNDAPASEPTTIASAYPTTATTPAPTSTAAPTTTAPAAVDCASVKVPRWDDQGPIKTVAQSSQPIDVSITLNPTTLCTMGTGHATVSFHNHGSNTEHVRDPQLTLYGGVDKWPLATLGTFDLSPGSSIDIRSDFTLPAVLPGTYQVFVYGFYSGYTDITVDGPNPSCSGLGQGSYLGAEEGQTDGAMGTEYTSITITNFTQHNCTLSGPPSSIYWIDAKGTEHPVEVLPSGMDPVRPVTLKPGGTATVNLGIAGMCMYATPAKAVPDNLWLRWPDGQVATMNKLPMPCPVFINTVNWPAS